MQVYFIAELGQNHNGSLDTAKEMIDSLVGTGVKAVKTAKRDIERFREEWEAMPYHNEHSYGKNYYEHRKALELSDDEWIELAEYAKDRGFDFIASFTDLKSLEFLKEKIKPTAYKIASSRVTDKELLYEVPKGKSVLSTGMSTPEEVIEAIMILEPIAILQCTSSYPTKREDINLNVVKTLELLSKDLLIGVSGHWEGIAPDLIAYAMGVDIIERHYTLDKGMKGRDHRCSIDLQDIKELSEAFNTIDTIKGSRTKEVLESELPNIKKLRHDLLV